jgi:NOL1/NOP2/sun family putative RNA methylase
MKPHRENIQAIPAAFLERMVGLLEDEYHAFYSSLQLPTITGLRVNTLKLSALDFLERSPWHLSPVAWCSNGFILECNQADTEQPQPGKHVYHASGLYYLQEPSAMAASEALGPQPGEIVLDLAAAPGGKTTHLAAMMGNSGLLVANEIHPKRVWDLVENLERCGVTNAIVTNETPQRLADQLGEYFDRVMLDAPCSGEGMFRKASIARQEWSTEHVRSCAIRQSGILDQAARLVKPGGYLAYTTCTFSPDENEGVIAKFLARHPEFSVQIIPPLSGFSPARPEWAGLPADNSLQRAVRIWPHHAQGEGHFIALLAKQGDPGSHLHQMEKRSPTSAHHRSRYSDVELAPMAAFCKENLSIEFDSYRLRIHGANVYHVPAIIPNLSGLRFIQPGWRLGLIRKGRLTPSHALAMGLSCSHAQHSLPLAARDPRVTAYLAGESFSDYGENAWILITVDDYPIGWGKRVSNRIKNYYPHSLRKRI